MTSKKVCAGMYEITHKGKKYVIEQLIFDTGEKTWIWRKESALYGDDSYPTKKQAMKALQNYLN